MSRFLRIGSDIIHVPSLANVSMTTNCVGRPYLCLYYHTQKTQTLSFPNHDACEKQMMRIKTAMKAVEVALEKIPLVEGEITLPPQQQQQQQSSEVSLP